MELTATNADRKGQHFMIDRKTIKFIIDHAQLLKDDMVLEIGYGHGELTNRLSKKCKVIAVDIEDNSSLLDKTVNKSIDIVHENILECFSSLYDKHHFNKIVSNIPYNISEPLIRLIFKIDLELIILTVGKGFAEILTSRNNRIGIIANALYEVEMLKKIHPKAFRPSPRTESAIVALRQRSMDYIPKASAVFKGLVLLDDKKLKNALEQIISANRRESKNIINNSGLKFLDKKIYQISNEEFLELNKFIENSI